MLNLIRRLLGRAHTTRAPRLAPRAVVRITKGGKAATITGKDQTCRIRPRKTSGTH